MNLELITIISNFGKASKIISSAKRHGVTGGTVLLGYGTIHHGLLNMLGLRDIRREILRIVVDESTVDDLMNDLNTEFEFYKPNHGIVYTSSICQVTGASSLSCDGNNLIQEEPMYQSINVIVDKGKGEDVIDAATSAGSKGGTIINARGSGIHETQKVFGIEIEPEKEIVVIIAKSTEVDNIISTIAKRLELEKPGNGILYVQNLNRTYGIYED